MENILVLLEYDMEKLLKVKGGMQSFVRKCKNNQGLIQFFFEGVGGMTKIYWHSR